MRDENGPVPATLETITGNENLLLLVASPGDESLGCGGLIAASCRRGRPPFVMVLGDGTGSYPASADYTLDEWARLRERETRAAVRCLGLPAERLLMAGLYDGQIPESGPMFDRVVKAVTLVMWARDCNVIAPPWPDGSAGAAATYRIAAAVTQESGVGLLAFALDTTVSAAAVVWTFDVTGQLAAKRAALSAHTALLQGQSVLDDPAPRLFPPLSTLRNYEVYVRAAD